MHRFRTIASVARRFAVLALTDTRTKILRRVVWSAAGLICLAFLLLLLALRYRVLPNIEDYRETIERQVSAKIGRDVTIGRISADWDGINPHLVLRNLSVLDNDKRPALSIPRIEAVLSWRSLVAPTLNLLRVEDIRLNLARDANGRLWVAGLSFDPSGGGETTETALTDWLFAQRRIQIHHASLVWEDALRRAPKLEIADIDLTLDNDWRRHRFSLMARLPRAIGSDIDLRGELVGKHWERPTGQAYIDIDRADLAAWKPWVDYPADLSKGQGSLRAWMDFSKGRIDLLTADFALNDVKVRVEKALPWLDLDSASGRIRVRMPKTGFEIEGYQVELTTRPSGALEATRIAPTDFRVEWETSREGKAGGARIEAGRIDFSAFANLSKYLPLDASTRERLQTYAPEGVVSGLEARWQGTAFPLQSYLLKADFERFGVNAAGHFSKLSGLTGALFANERGGTLTLRSERAVVELRKIFPETRIALDKLDADASWRIQNGALEVKLSNADFSGTDAAGAARGSYRYTGGGAGYIDMTGELTRADAKAVWRYIPSVVGIGARHWLRDALLSGASNEARLTLKGNLDDFPFNDPQKGLFLVTVKARNVTLNYGKDWPKITGINGDLRFEKSGMHIIAQEGRILGAQIGGGDGVDAVIPDFDAPTCHLLLKGGVSGPTSEFLKFIEKSPVAQRIGYVTQDMRASGSGALALTLDIPLDEAKLADSKVSGTYRFRNNALVLDPDFPTLQKVSGAFHFSGTDLRIEEVGAAFLGGTLKVGGGKQADGKVRIVFNGTANLSKSQEIAHHPWSAMLSGSAAYQGEAHVSGQDVSLTVSSSLVGMASALPEPFQKTAGQSMPLSFERKMLPRRNDGGKTAAVSETPRRDQLTARLGDALNLKITRRERNGIFSPVFGVITVGQARAEAVRHNALNVYSERLDLDDWLDVIGTDLSKGNAAQDSTRRAPTVLRTPAMTLFGRNYDEVDATISNQGSSWQIALNSRQASGSLLWQSEGGDKLTVKLDRLAIPSAKKENVQAFIDDFKTLPDMDISVGDFTLGNYRFGRLELQADNENGFWKLNRIQINNPAARFEGNAEWRVGETENTTRLSFKLDSGNVGELLKRFDLGGVLLNGNASLEGQLQWNGSPIALDYGTLNGDMALNADRGQFLQVEPGIGKLLSLVNMQSLHRRVALDFQDVFGKGFAFDTLSGQFAIQKGVMRTDRLVIDGPAARVALRGQTDIKKETQDISVKVTPSLGGTAAVGVAVANPLLGLVTLIADKIMQNPLGRMFSLDYKVTGTWLDPVIEKIEKVSETDPPKNEADEQTVP